MACYILNFSTIACYVAFKYIKINFNKMSYIKPQSLVGVIN